MNEFEFETVDDVLNEANARDAAKLDEIKVIVGKSDPAVKAEALRDAAAALQISAGATHLNIRQADLVERQMRQWLLERADEIEAT